MNKFKKERQEDLIRTIPDVADIYWELEELKSKYQDAKEELLQIRINDEVYRLNEQIKVLNKENDNLRQEIKEWKDSLLVVITTIFEFKDKRDFIN